jgi:hypothetical protein
MRVGARARACGLTYLSCNAHAPYRVLRPRWLHHIYRNYRIKGTILGNKLLNIKSVFWFSLQLLFEIFLILRRIYLDIATNVKTSLCKIPIILVGF